MLCIVCHEDDVPAHQMATTPCSARHGKVTCKKCLLKWFEHKLSCPLCNAPLRIKCVLRKTDVRARYRLKLARQAAKLEVQEEARRHDAQVARQMQQEELLHAYFNFN